MLLVANLHNLRAHAADLIGNAAMPPDFEALHREWVGTRPHDVHRREQLTPERRRFDLLVNLCTRPITKERGVHISHTIRERLALIDKVLGTHGVEGMLLDENGDDCSGSCEPAAYDIQYCNTGDTYALTILYYRGKLRIGDWGSIVESISSPEESRRARKHPYIY